MSLKNSILKKLKQVNRKIYFSHEYNYINVYTGKLRTILLTIIYRHSNILKKNGSINNRKLRIVRRGREMRRWKGIKEGFKGTGIMLVLRLCHCKFAHFIIIYDYSLNCTYTFYMYMLYVCCISH